MAGRLALLLGSLMIAALGGELALRVVPRSTNCGGRPPLWRPDRITGWALTPGAVDDVSVCSGRRELARHRIEINALGQRDRRRDVARRADVSRVLVLGDSFTEALQVDLDETFLARIERSHGIEMLNAGVSGYATDNELRAFESRGRRFRPDAVVLVLYTGNDVHENGARLYLGNPHGLPAKPWLRATAPSPGLAACLGLHRSVARASAVVPDVLWERSRLLRFALTDGTAAVLQVLSRPVSGPPLPGGVPEQMGVYGPPTTPAWREAWATTERLLRKLDRRVARAGASFAVVIAPAGPEIEPARNPYRLVSPKVRDGAWDYEYPRRRLGAFLDRAGIRWHSLTPALARHFAETQRSGYYEWDGHWTAEGHAIVADDLTPFVTGLVANDPHRAPGRDDRRGAATRDPASSFLTERR